MKLNTLLQKKDMVHKKHHILPTNTPEHVYQHIIFFVQDTSFNWGISGSFGLSTCGWPLAVNCQTRSRRRYQVVDRYPVTVRILIDRHEASFVFLHRRPWTGRARYFHGLTQRVSNLVARPTACTHFCLSDRYLPWQSTHSSDQRYVCARSAACRLHEMWSSWILSSVFHSSRRCTQPLSKPGHLAFLGCSRVHWDAVTLSKFCRRQVLLWMLLKSYWRPQVLSDM